MKLTSIGKNRWRLQKSKDMKVNAVVYMNERLVEDYLESQALKQLADACELPGVCDPVLGMPDLHQGYGLPIGGVMAVRASDADRGESIVSAGAVGYDINCGVRLLRTDMGADELNKEDLRDIIAKIVGRVPVGVGKSNVSAGDMGHQMSFSDLVTRGAGAIVNAGFGRPGDVQACEEQGAMRGARPDAVPSKAKGRADQLATTGGGNHFIELDRVSRVYDSGVAEVFGLSEGQLVVMIHTGSRGFGHEICSQYSSLMIERAPRYGVNLPTKGLAAVPIGSTEGSDYLGAMACAVNYAFANRQLITHKVRKALADFFGKHDEQLGLQLVYDVAHNIAKFEEHGGRRVLVHRKGATRALPPGHQDNPPRYRSTGHPALIPGSMGTASYVTVGTEATSETYHSVNHGAGRIMSRRAANRKFDTNDLRDQLGDVVYGGVSARRVLDEAPGAYKDVDGVVESLAEIGITNKVARLEPVAVIKGS